MWEPIDSEGWEETPTLLLKGAVTWIIPTCCFKPDCAKQNIGGIVKDLYENRDSEK
jgi:hypothetical protein